MSKKTFKEIPNFDEPIALSFMSSSDFPFPFGEEAPERKSKRLNLLLKPSLFEALKKAAELQGTSVNALINTVLEAYTQENEEALIKGSALIEESKALFEKKEKEQ